MLGREESRVDTENLVSQVKELVNEGNVQRVIVRNEDGKKLFDVPLTMAPPEPPQQSSWPWRLQRWASLQR